MVTMIASAVSRGFATARREWRLAIVLWLSGLVLAATAVVPFYRYLSAATALSPEADRLLGGASISVMADMAAADARGWGALIGAAFGLALLARLANAFFMGGIVEVLAGRRSTRAPGRPGEAVAGGLLPEPISTRVTALEANGLRAHEHPVATGDVGLERPAGAGEVVDVCTGASLEAPLAEVVIGRREPLHPLPAGAGGDAAPREDDRPMMHRFFRGAGRFFLRNLVMLVANSIALAVVAGLLFALGRAAVRPLEDTLSLPLSWLRTLLPIALGGLGAWLMLLTYDYACIRLVTQDSRRPLRTWLSALAFTARRFLPAAALWLVPGVLLALAALLLVRPTWRIPATTGAMLITVGAQQIFTLLRAWLRTAAVASEIEFAAARGFAAAPEVRS
jgi:hypothetical protein